MPVQGAPMPKRKGKKSDAKGPFSYEATIAGVESGVTEAIISKGGAIVATVKIPAAGVVPAVGTRQRPSTYKRRKERIERLFNSAPSPSDLVTLNDEIWFNILPKSADLMYLGLSGKFSRKNNFSIQVNGIDFPLSGAFRKIARSEHIPSAYSYTVYNGEIIAYSIHFADPTLRSVIASAVFAGKAFIDKVSSGHYMSLNLDNNLFGGGSGYPPNDSFAAAIYFILTNKNIDSNLFMERTHLDYNIFSNLKNKADYAPERSTCKAILFAVQPSILEAIFLFGLAGYQFKRDFQDSMLLSFFGNEDYDIDKYNYVMTQKGYPQLGSKNYNKGK